MTILNNPYLEKAPDFSNIKQISSGYVCEENGFMTFNDHTYNNVMHFETYINGNRAMIIYMYSFSCGSYIQTPIRVFKGDVITFKNLVGAGSGVVCFFVGERNEIKS